MKNYIVEFLNDGARVIKDPEEIERKKNLPNVLIRPELPKKVSPSFWCKDGDKIGVIEDKKKVLVHKEKKKIADSKKEYKHVSDSIKKDILMTVHPMFASMSAAYDGLEVWLKNSEHDTRQQIKTLQKMHLEFKKKVLFASVAFGLINLTLIFWGIFK